MPEADLVTGSDLPAAEIAVRVAVRVRPLVPKERLEQCRSCVRAYADERQVVIGKDRGFAFDFVFGEESSQRLVFEDACAPLVQRCFQGYNATVFAYGQARLHSTQSPPHPVQLLIQSLPHSCRLAAARRSRWGVAALPVSLRSSWASCRA
jgi:hypothetical protein